MFDRLEDAAAAGIVGVQHALVALRGLQQRRFGTAHAHALEAGVEHRQVVERIAGDQDAVAAHVQLFGQRDQGAALVGARRQDVQVTVGGIEHVAAQFAGSGLDVVAVARQHVGVAEIGAAALLRHVLALQGREAAHGLGDHVFAGPARVDARLQRLQRLQRAAAGHRRADVADQVVRARQRRIGKQGDHGLEAAAGDPDQADARMLVDQAVEPLAVAGFAGQEGAVQVGGQHQGGFVGEGVHGFAFLVAQRVSLLLEARSASVWVSGSSSSAAGVVRSIGWNGVGWARPRRAARRSSRNIASAASTAAK